MELNLSKNKNSFFKSFLSPRTDRLGAKLNEREAEQLQPVLCLPEYVSRFRGSSASSAVCPCLREFVVSESRVKTGPAGGEGARPLGGGSTDGHGCFRGVEQKCPRQKPGTLSSK